MTNLSNLSKIIHFTGPLIRASARSKMSVPANTRHMKTASLPNQKMDENIYSRLGEGSWDPNRWRECAWLLDLMDDMAQFAEKESLQMTSESLRYSREICRADILHQATNKSE